MRAVLHWVASCRLLHFAALGGAIFALTPRAHAGRDVEIPAESLDALHSAEARRLGQASLSPGKIREVDERAVEDEVLYREALRLGLDVGDPIVRQRLIQKVLFLAEDLGGASRAPTDDELRAYYAATQDAWARPTTFHFVHVFASSESRALALRAEVEQHAEPGAPNLGEALPFPRDATLTRERISATYGAEFAEQVSHAPLFAWSAPVRSQQLG